MRTVSRSRPIFCKTFSATTCCARGVKLFIVRWPGRRAIARLPYYHTDIRFGKEFQTLANNLRAQMVAFLRVQFLLRGLLQMRRLRVDEKLIDGQTPIFRKRAQIDAEFDDRQ